MNLDCRFLLDDVAPTTYAPGKVASEGCNDL